MVDISVTLSDHSDNGEALAGGLENGRPSRYLMGFVLYLGFKFRKWNLENYVHSISLNNIKP